MHPDISIIIPVYNAEGTISRSLISLRNQRYSKLEVIVVDAKSSDNTVNIVQSYRDIVQTLISEPDSGQANALNKGFAKARGKIVGWLGADDELELGALESVASAFSNDNHLDLITGACRKVFVNGTQLVCTPPEYFAKVIGMQYLIDQPSTFWRKSLMDNIIIDESFHYAFDWDLFARLVKRARDIKILPNILSTYHFSDSNKTSTGGRKLILELKEVIRRHGPLEGKAARIFYFLYRNFDLKGCYDTPPTCTIATGKKFSRVIELLIKKYGKDIIYSYNWNFASKQERGLIWYQ